MVFLLRRAARMAPSLIRLARSAPEKPGRDLADARSRSTRLVERLALGVHFEDRLAAVDVGRGQHDLAVEAARPQQGRIEHVGAVGGGDDDDVGVRVEAVHLDQDLIQGLLALVVRAAQAGAALAADGVDLVDEDDARRVALGLIEQVAHAAGADADEHLDELRARDAEEGHARLAGDGAARAASCPCLAGRPAARPWGCARRARRTSRGTSGTRRLPGAPAWPLRRRPRPGR